MPFVKKLPSTDTDPRSKQKNNAGNDRSKTIGQSIDLHSIQQKVMLSSGSSLTRDVAYLQRTFGNRHTAQLLKAATEGHRNGASQPLHAHHADNPGASHLNAARTDTIQRLVTYKGALAELDEEDDDFKNLPPDQQTKVRNQHQDRTQTYDYPDQASFYAHVGGDTDPGKAPKITAIDPKNLEKAKRRKNRTAFYRKHKKIGPVTDNPHFNKPENKGMLPVFYPMSQEGLDEKSVQWTKNPMTDQYELFRSKDLTASQEQELDEMSLTVIEEKKSGKVHWTAHVGSNPVSSFTDTDIKSRPSGKRKSEYGGATLEDFAEDSVGPTSMNLTDRSSHYKKKKTKKKPQATRGHQQAYEDTITKPSEKTRLILGSGQKQVFKASKSKNIRTTDQEQEPLPSGTIPSAMSPEQYDVGQHGRRTQFETPTRKEKGVYFEVNELTSDSGTTIGGLDIPGKKYYASASKDRKPLKAAVFDQYAPVYSEKEDAGGWGEYTDENKIDPDDLPQQHFFASDEEVDFSDSDTEPATPQFLPQFEESIDFFSPDELQLGQALGQTWQGHDDWIVSEYLANTTAGFKYRLTRTRFA